MRDNTKNQLIKLAIVVVVGSIGLLWWIYAQQAVQPLSHAANWARIIGMPGY